MKTVISLIFFIIMQLCTNPKKIEHAIFEKRENILGKWQLFETCISPGSICEIKKIENGLILEFKSDGSYFVSNNNTNDNIYTCNGKYTLVEIKANPVQKGIQLSPSCNKALWTMYLSFNFDNTLNINPQCIEECRYTYRLI